MVMNQLLFDKSRELIRVKQPKWVGKLSGKLWRSFP